MNDAKKEVERFLKKFTKEDIEKIVSESAEKAKEAERKRNAPPEMPTGTCVFCQGKVIGEHARVATTDHRHIPIGPGGSAYYRWKFLGYHCTKCGLLYKFAPQLDKINKEFQG